MTHTIDILSIPVSDPARAKTFYMDTLGFELVHEGEMGPDQKWIQLRLPNTETSISLVTWFDSMPAGSLRGLLISIADVVASRAGLIAKGVDATDIEDAPWGKYAMFNDSEGNGLILMQSAF